MEKSEMEIPEGWNIRILVIEAGHVKVCYCPDPDGHVFWLPYMLGRTIRRWGTTEGLAELQVGPTNDTILDAIVKSGKLPVRAIIDTFEVEEDKWTSHLKLSESSTRKTRRQSSQT